MLLTMAATKSLAQDQKQIFIYCPNERAGLHIAQQTEAGWQEIGQLCSSDYGTWGAEKRMYHPSVADARCGLQQGSHQLASTGLPHHVYPPMPEPCCLP